MTRVDGPATPSFDAAATLARVAGDRDLLRELVVLLCEDTPGRIARVTRTLANGDLEGTQKAAHALKGAATTFGAERAVATALRVERLAADRDLQALPEAIEELDEEHTRLCRELTEFVGD
ncbi:MAG: Hpt domain-containing protein, partial [Thermoanaerobaculia bacterium]